MLDRAGNANGDVELRRHDLAGLPDLVVVGNEPGVYCRARRSDRRSELVRERFQDLEILRAAHAAAAGNDDARSGKFRPFRLR
ncbi:hypothetical protein D3C83_147540 [compost metagenome]